MIYRVGQKVKLIAADANSSAYARGYVGKEAVVIAVPSRLPFPGNVDCDVDFGDGTGAWACPFYHLAPLLNPGTERDAAAERFLDGLRKLGREPVTLTVRELEKISGGRAVLPSGCAPIVGRGGK